MIVTHSFVTTGGLDKYLKKERSRLLRIIKMLNRKFGSGLSLSPGREDRGQLFSRVIGPGEIKGGESIKLNMEITLN